eukprot:TRINITY_DN2387_c0_g1_i10.p1 TRINITY_DN2387_c0_g1~~TRINITY_DN2387_c0_g1_i10.p1  ORF type:complete len:515 (+),score=71.12 TRINITY_DN2387_c0_g1_i10:409-1953(+)
MPTLIYGGPLRLHLRMMKKFSKRSHWWIFHARPKWWLFLNDVASYLTNMNLMLIVSVDQYNNLRKNIIADHPFVVITCLAEDNQYTSVRVVITSSTSHFIPGEIPKNPLAEWRTFVWYEGLTAQEFASWCDRYRIPFRSTVAELTGRYPMELQRARDIIETAKPSSPLLFSQLYIRQTKQYLETKTGEFLSAGIKLQIPNFLELAATPALLVGSKIKIGNIPVRFMDERFFFIDNEDEVQALTPTFAKILATYWASVLRHDPVHPTLLNILQSDRKCAGAFMDNLIISGLEADPKIELFLAQPKNGLFRGITSVPNLIVFSGDFPEISQVDWKKQDLLFIPKNKQYRGVDFFFWLAATTEMFAIRLTVGHKHSDNFVEESTEDKKLGRLAPKKLLDGYLQGVCGQAETTKMVWVVTDMKPPETWVDRGDYFCHMACLHYVHPVVRDYALAELARVLERPTIPLANLNAALAELTFTPRKVKAVQRTGIYWKVRQLIAQYGLAVVLVLQLILLLR